MPVPIMVQPGPACAMTGCAGRCPTRWLTASRMPVSTFVSDFDDQSFSIVEHEMGHGFGFQDYYSWTGSTPAGGSLMIVGSTGGKQPPTSGDTWLLRRTWKEMVALRGW